MLDEARVSRHYGRTNQIGWIRPADLGIGFWSYAYKVIVAILLTPRCFVAHGILTTRLGIEPAPHGYEG